MTRIPTTLQLYSLLLRLADAAARLLGWTPSLEDQLQHTGTVQNGMHVTARKLHARSLLAHSQWRR